MRAGCQYIDEERSHLLGTDRFRSGASSPIVHQRCPCRASSVSILIALASSEVMGEAVLLVLVETLAVDREDCLSSPDNRTQPLHGKRQCRLFPRLTHCCLDVVLTVFQSAPDGEPPSGSWLTWISATQQKKTITLINEKDAGCPSPLQHHGV